MDEVIASVRNGVGTIVLNRPTRKNALTVSMVDSWVDALQQFRVDVNVRTIVITGSGDGFCSGVDLAAVEETRSATDWKVLLSEHVHRIPLLLEDIDKPVIAAVNGVAVGAGMDMALMCDMRFAGRSARFSEGYIRVGLVPGDGGCYYLPRLVGSARALELLWTGDFIDATEAERIGIVNRVCDDTALRDETQRFAERLAQAPALAIRTIKRALYQSLKSDLKTSLDLISSHLGIVAQEAESRTALDSAIRRRS